MIVDVNFPQKGGGSGENKLAQVVSKTVTEINEGDLEGATKIGNYAFSDCSGLTSITIPDSVTSIGGYAFRECTSLTSIIIPDGVTSIGNSAFFGCSKLTEMTIKATTPPSLTNTRVISTATTTIYIPLGTLEAYSTATNWSNFASKFVEKEM